MNELDGGEIRAGICSKRAMCVSLGAMREERCVGCSNSDSSDGGDSARIRQRG